MTGALEPVAAGPDRALPGRAVSTWQTRSSSGDEGPGAAIRRAGRAAATFLRLRPSDLAVLLPVLVVGMALTVVGLFRYPRLTESEGSLAAPAITSGTSVALGDPFPIAPLGWLQTTAWARAAQALEPSATTSGRVLMMVALAVSAVLLWALVRRIGMPRGAGAAALLLYLASPLAIQVHRGLALENLATAWILAAFVLATARSRQLVAFVLAVMAAVGAALTSTAFGVLVLFVAWQLVRSTRLATRRYTLTVAGAVLVLAALAYPVVALLGGGIVPGDDRSALPGAVGAAARSLEPSDAVTAPTVLLGAPAVAEWLELSPALLVFGAIAMLLALLSYLLRPYAAALLVLTALLSLAPDGEVGVVRVVAMLPLIAVVVPGVAWLGWRRFADRVEATPGRVAVAVVGLAAAVAVTVPLAVSPWRAQVSSDANASLSSALGWIEQEVPRDDRVVADDVVRVGLDGTGRQNVLAYTQVGATSEGQDIDWVVVTEPVRAAAGQVPVLEAAIESAVLVAAFGQQADRIEILRVEPEGEENAVDQEDTAEAAARAAFGAQLAQNPHLTLVQGAEALSAGLLDPRAQLLLADLTADGEVVVADLPEIAGEEGRLRRTLVLTAVQGEVLDFAAQRAVLDRLLQLPPGWAPTETEQDIGELTLTWSLSPPAGLLPAAEP